MGYLFDLRDANVLGWLTWSEARPQNFDDEDLEHFLLAIARDGDANIISRDAEWRAQIISRAEEIHWACRRAHRHAWGVLTFLREVFGRFPFYALAIGEEQHFYDLHEFVRKYASRQDLPGLFLCPRDPAQTRAWVRSEKGGRTFI